MCICSCVDVCVSVLKHGILIGAGFALAHVTGRGVVLTLVAGGTGRHEVVWLSWNDGGHH